MIWKCFEIKRSSSFIDLGLRSPRWNILKYFHSEIIRPGCIAYRYFDAHVYKILVSSYNINVLGERSGRNGPFVLQKGNFL